MEAVAMAKKDKAAKALKKAEKKALKKLKKKGKNGSKVDRSGLDPASPFSS
jgi:hypothetical protein